VISSLIHPPFERHGVGLPLRQRLVVSAPARERLIARFPDAG
jgi:hypothetical protein